MNKKQQLVIEYLLEENRVLKELHGKKRMRFNNSQRVRLAKKGKLLGWKALNGMSTLVRPETVLRWYRELADLSWTAKQMLEGENALINEIFS